MNTENFDEQTTANNALAKSQELKEIIEQRIKKSLAKSHETINETAKV